MSRLSIAALVALVLGPALAFITIKDTNEKKKIESEGIETTAVPVSKSEKRGRKGGTTYKLKLHYAVQGGAAQTADVSVPEELYHRVDADPVVPIKYLKESPDKVIVVGQRIEQPENLYISGVLVLFGVIGTWWSFFRKKPAVEEPEAVPA